MRRFTLLFIFCTFYLLSTSAQDSTNFVDVNGLKQGKWMVRHDNGQLRYSGQFKDGKPTGEFRYFAADGNHTKTLLFNGDSAFARFFHTSGELMAEGIYLKEKKHGKWKYYDEEGDISIQEMYKDGKRNGPSRVYYKNGEISRDCNYKEDVMHGQCTDYFQGGKKKFEGSYVDGNLDGKVVHYNPTGLPWQSGQYKAAIKDGKWLIFNEKAELEAIEVYELGKLLRTTPPPGQDKNENTKPD